MEKRLEAMEEVVKETDQQSGMATRLALGMKMELVALERRVKALEAP